MCVCVNVCVNVCVCVCVLPHGDFVALSVRTFPRLCTVRDTHTHAYIQMHTHTQNKLCHGLHTRKSTHSPHSPVHVHKYV